MQRHIRFIFILNLIAVTVSAQSVFKLKDDNGGIRPKLQLGEKTIISAPDEGLWSVATAWENKWPAQWHHASPVSMEQSGDWQIVKGEIVLPQVVMKVRDAYRNEKGLVHCIRRFEWTGKSDIDSLTLSVRWNVSGKGLQAFLPGIVFYGNPSGTKNTPNCVASYSGKAGEKAIFEDHRYPMPFACLESSVADKFGAVIHTVPSPLRDAKLFDHWWSMGVEAFDDHAELVLYSGPITYNNRPSIAKAIQCGNLEYDNTYIKMSPDQVIEKSFYLDAYPINSSFASKNMVKIIA